MGGSSEIQIDAGLTILELDVKSTLAVLVNFVDKDSIVDEDVHWWGLDEVNVRCKLGGLDLRARSRVNNVSWSRVFYVHCVVGHEDLWYSEVDNRRYSS